MALPFAAGKVDLVTSWPFCLNDFDRLRRGGFDCTHCGKNVLDDCSCNEWLDVDFANEEVSAMHQFMRVFRIAGKSGQLRASGLSSHPLELKLFRRDAAMAAGLCLEQALSIVMRRYRELLFQDRIELRPSLLFFCNRDSLQQAAACGESSSSAQWGPGGVRFLSKKLPVA